MPKQALATVESNNELAAKINEAMEDKGLSIRELAHRVDTTYEHIRRVTNGESIPSKFLLKALCQELGLDVKQASTLATKDRIYRQFGEVPLEMAGKKPGMYPIEQVWDRLSPQHQADLVQMAQLWAKADRVGR